MHIKHIQHLHLKKKKIEESSMSVISKDMRRTTKTLVTEFVKEGQTRS